MYLLSSQEFCSVGNMALREAWSSAEVGQSVTVTDDADRVAEGARTSGAGGQARITDEDVGLGPVATSLFVTLAISPHVDWLLFEWRFVGALTKLGFGFARPCIGILDCFCSPTGDT